MAARKVITEEDVLSIKAGGTLQVSTNSIITPSAIDRANANKIKIVAAEDPKKKIVALGADHAGFDRKEQIKKWIAELGYEVRDFGTHDTNPVDYPDFAFAVAMAVARGECHFGIVIDGAGIGSCMAANKVPGIRAAMCYDEATAKNSREHNFANVLTLGARLIDEATTRHIVNSWLVTGYGEERHARRVHKITQYEEKLRGKDVVVKELSS